MRRGILHVAVVAVSVALVILGIPLGIGARVMIIDAERGELERVALLAASHVGPDVANGDPIELGTAEPGQRVAVYDASLALRTDHGSGPTSPDAVTRAALSGRPGQGQTGDELVVSVPVAASEDVVAVVRAATPLVTVRTWVLQAWAALALGAVLALGVAVLVARRQATRLSRPIEALAAAAERVAGGDLGVRTEPTGHREATHLAQAQNAMLDRLTGLLERERRFSADVSHQLRTPLTGLALGLEHAVLQQGLEPAADLRPLLLELTARVQDMEATVEDLLRLAGPEPAADLAAQARVVDEVVQGLEVRWRPRFAALGRVLTVTLDTGTDGSTRVPGFAVTEVVGILLENAAIHGRGRVDVIVRDLGIVTAVDVADEGDVSHPKTDLFERGVSPEGAGSGIGLSLGRSIAEAAGGRLSLAGRSPTRFTLLVPSDEPVRTERRRRSDPGPDRPASG